MKTRNSQGKFLEHLKVINESRVQLHNINDNLKQCNSKKNLTKFLFKDQQYDRYKSPENKKMKIDEIVKEIEQRKTISQIFK